MALIINDNGNLTNVNEVFHIEEESSTVNIDLNEVMHIEDQNEKSKKVKKSVDLRETIHLEPEDDDVIQDLNE